MDEAKGVVSLGLGDDVLDEVDVQGIFGFRRRGWYIKRIARELGISRNCVRSWVRRGEGAPRTPMGRPRALEGYEAWVRERYVAGVRNGDVLRQELSERGVQVSLRTVENRRRRVFEIMQAESVAQLTRMITEYEHGLIPKGLPEFWRTTSGIHLGKPFGCQSSDKTRPVTEAIL